MESFWQREVPGQFPPASGTKHVDIAIVGAGYTGSWLAYWLRDYGSSVTVLEAETPGFGASGRNGGLMLQGPAQLLADAADSLGEENARVIAQMTRESFSWVREIETRHAIDFHATGSLYLAGGVDERPAVEKTAALYQKMGVPARLIDRSELPRSLGTLNGDAALWIPDDGMIHPLKLIRALLAEATARGVEICAHSPVAEIEETPNGVLLHGPNFSVQAERAVIAANAYSASLLPHHALPIQPVRGQVLVTQPLPPLDHAYPVYADHGFNYWHQRPDGRLVIGGFRHLAMDEEQGTDLILHRAIQDKLTQLARHLAGAPITIGQRWAGIMAMTPDHRPYLGPLSPSLWIAAGFNGHGSTVTPVAARMLRDALVEGAPIFEPYQVERIR
ncbi:FAD-dependent oxidoreductase [Sulfobacillus harzensis]|uniref:FAD-dependent oxidoreductase n=1 Tax=Sulfobacillus harzensis TaxID=2729629 RepID=A0A7Y0Q1X7_9FIRM|nr:FAD-dependent oxidoreductase [Sulfobacillus harzensis]